MILIRSYEERKQDRIRVLKKRQFNGIWFAWHPVQVNDGSYVWLEKVRVQQNLHQGDYESWLGPRWYYKLEK